MKRGKKYLEAAKAIKAAEGYTTIQFVEDIIALCEA